MEICQQQCEIKMRHLPAADRLKRYGRWSGGIDEPNTFQLKFFI